MDKVRMHKHLKNRILYLKSDMQWTDRMQQVKMLLMLMAVVIAVVSLVISHLLVRDLEAEEHRKMEIWAEAMRAFNNADENTDLSLVLKVIDDNHTIPVIVMDSKGSVQTYRNVDVGSGSEPERTAKAERLGRQWLKSGQVIRIAMGENGMGDHIDVCFDDSVMIKRLSAYPYVQLGVVMLFVFIAIYALLTSKRAEQNKVWVGLSKETAHQLGTPISSLMAWTEVLRETYPDDTLIPELDKDVKRLRLIADRFSKIGSQPEPVPSSLNEVVSHVIDYMDRRTSKTIHMVKDLPEGDIIVNMCPQLFEWVVENLCKNAVDAMGGSNGVITISVFGTPDTAVIEVADTGKGIPKKNIGNVFRPGFTTKKRGWGLGLSLAKRIVEEYHHGQIFVKQSEVGKGTTFRIELKKQG